MSKLFWIVVVPVLAYIAIVALATYFTVWFWAWIVPDLFQGIVAAGYLHEKITLLQSFKFIMLLSFLRAPHYINNNK